MANDDNNIEDDGGNEASAEGEIGDVDGEGEATATGLEMDYPLALGVSGEPIEVPENAAGWRVSWRKLHERGGSPSLVYWNGRPLVLALTATADDLMKAISGKTGRYRLDPIDRSQRVIPGATPAYSVIERVNSTSAPDNDNPDPMSRRFDEVMTRMDRTVQALENAFSVQSQQVAAVLQACAQNVAPASRVVREVEQVTVQTAAPPEKKFDLMAAVTAFTQVMPFLQQLFPTMKPPFMPPNGGGNGGGGNGGGEPTGGP